MCSCVLRTHFVGIWYGTSIPPLTKAPPWMYIRTGCRPCLDFTLGAQILRYRQSSDISPVLFNPCRLNSSTSKVYIEVPRLERYWGQLGGNFLAWSCCLPAASPRGDGGLHLRSAVGDCAYGIPRNCRTFPPSLLWLFFSSMNPVTIPEVVCIVRAFSPSSTSNDSLVISAKHTVSFC